MVGHTQGRRFAHLLQGFRPAVRADAFHAPRRALGLQDLQIRRVVVHDQHADASEGSHGQRFRRRRGDRFHARREPEARALSRSAVQADLAAHHFHEPLGDREPQPSPAVVTGGRSVGLDERRKDCVLVLRGDADTGVADFCPDEHARARDVGDRDRDHHFAVGGELDGVVEQVREDLAEPEAVGDDASGYGIIEAADQLQPLTLCARCEQGHRLLDDRSQIARRAVQLELARLDLGDVEDVIDDRQEDFA